MSVHINYLLNKIHLYYSVGMPNLFKTYEGYAKFRSILHDKIEDVRLGNDKNWLSLIEKLKVFSMSEISNLSYLQFPSYKAKVQLKIYTIENLTCTTSIVIVVSLLTKKFTYYFEDHVRFLFYPNQKITSSEIINIYLKSKNSYDVLMLADIKEMIKKCFPMHDYIDHLLLFSHKIESGFPNDEFDINPIGSYSLYYYLFDNSLNPTNVHIFE